MKPNLKLEEAFADGSLVHPLRDAPNSVDLFRAVARMSGGTGEPETPAERRLAESIGHHDHYLFVLVDGLGLSLEPTFPPGGFFASHLTGPLHSVFPSTTAAALTSLATGAWPARHGLTGWQTHFPEHRRVIAPLIFRERSTDVPADELGLSMDDLVEPEPVLGTFFRGVRSVLPREISRGAYATWSRGGTPIDPYRSFAHATRLLRRVSRRPAGPTYTYLYVLTVDKLSHSHGTTSSQVADEVARVDRMLARLRDRLPDTVRMIVTADHGLVDVPDEYRYTVRDEDPIAKHLVAGPSGEGTTPVFHVRPGDVDRFLDSFADHPASESFTLVRPDALAAHELYGPEPLSEAMRLHLGDYVGIATRHALLQYVPPGREPIAHIGVHGGLRPGEVRVPLFLA